jgi:hypothetical protein
MEDMMHASDVRGMIQAFIEKRAEISIFMDAQ